MEHCCLGLEGALESYGSPFRYIPYERQYIVEYNSSFTNEESGEIACVVASTLSYCPWCGKKLPKDLMDEWQNEIGQKFGIKNALDKEELKKVPQEYMTEEWWVKRGL